MTFLEKQLFDGHFEINEKPNKISFGATDFLAYRYMVEKILNAALFDCVATHSHHHEKVAILQRKISEMMIKTFLSICHNEDESILERKLTDIELKDYKPVWKRIEENCNPTEPQ